MTGRRGVLLLAVALLVTGCAGAPTSGPVQPGLQGPVPGAADPLVRPLANPPRPGMTQLEIVAGFLAATAAVGDDYQVARLYLDPSAAQTWDPGAGVTVMAEESPRLAQSGDVVTASFEQTGSVSSAGVVVAQPAAGRTQDFPTIRVGDEWRIAAPPEGLLLSSIDLDRAYELRHVYFIEPSGSYAVPDARLLPRTGSEALATGLVDAMLAGPSDWLAPAVTSAVPIDTELALGAVPVANGVARVELVGPAADLDDAALQWFGAQLAWTLQQVPGLEAFEVRLSGDRVPLTDGRGPVSVTQYDSFQPDVLSGEVPLYGVNQDGAAVAVIDDEVVQLDIGAGAPALGSVSVAPAGPAVAGVAVDGASLVTGRLQPGELPVAVFEEEQVAGTPSIDALDRIWWVSADGSLRTVGGTREVPATVVVENAPGTLRSVDISREGTRALLGFATAAGGEVFLGVVIDEPTGPRVQGLRNLGSAPGVTDAAWGSAQEMVLLSGTAGAVRRHDLLGSVTGVFNVSEGSQVVTDAPDNPSALGLADGTAGPLTGSGVRVLPGLSAPAYPG